MTGLDLNKNLFLAPSAALMNTLQIFTITRMVLTDPTGGNTPALSVIDPSSPLQFIGQNIPTSTHNYPPAGGIPYAPYGFNIGNMGKNPFSLDEWNNGWLPAIYLNGLSTWIVADAKKPYTNPNIQIEFFGHYIDYNYATDGTSYNPTVMNLVYNGSSYQTADGSAYIDVLAIAQL